MRMTPEEIKQLAREIAIAQLTAADDLVDEVTRQWPAAFRDRVPPRNDPRVTQEQRFQVFRTLRSEVALALEKEQRAAEEQARREAEEAARLEAYIQAEVERDQRRYAEEKTTYDAMCTWLRTQGRPRQEFPPEPKPPLTAEEIKQRHRQHR